MTELPIFPPIKGLDESGPFSNQPLQTSRDLLNVRSEDPYTARIRLSQRSGVSKFTSPSSVINGAQKIQHGTSITYDSGNVSHAAPPIVSGTYRFAFTVPSEFSCLNVKVGRQSDVYCLDGPAGVVKTNSAGEKQWRLSLPVQDPLHVCRALCLDEQDNVYVAVSTGGDQTKARIFKIVQDLENKTHVDDVSQGAWVITPGGFIEDMAVRDGVLYTAQNFPDRWGSRMVMYSAIGTAVPQIAWQHGSGVGGDMAYPINSFTILPNGDYATSHEPFAGRSQGDPRFPDNSPRLIDWTPDLLTSKDQRIWAWFDPADLISVNELEEDETVDIWFDKSGNDRNLFKHTEHAAPRFNKQGIAGQPTVRFSGGATSGTTPALQSDTNVATSRDAADQQKTLLPSYTGATDAEKAMFALFVVLRPTVDAQIRSIMGQSNTLGSSGVSWQLLMNRTPGATIPGSAAAGAISVHDVPSAGGGGAGGMPGNGTASTYTIPTGGIQAAGLTILHDGGRTTTNPKSLWRQNGTPVDRWDSTAFATFLRTEIATYSTLDPAVQQYKGELSDILVLRDFASATDGLLSHPYAPDGGGDSSGDSELERIEGWIHWKNGIAHLLPSAHPFSRLKGPPRAAGVAAESKPLLLLSENGIVAKWGAGKGNLRWVVTSRIAQGSFPAVACSGIGYGITSDSDGNIYTTGPIIVAPADASVRDNAVMRKIIDNGDSATISAGTTSLGSPTPNSPTGAWSKTSQDIDGVTSARSWTYKYPRLATDTFNNVYVPWHELVTSSARSVTVWDKTGQYDLLGVYSVTSPAGSDGYAVAIDPALPEYDSDFPGGSAALTARAQFFYLGTATLAQGPSVYGVQFVTASTTTGSPRTTVHLAVSGGTIKRFDGAAVSSPAGAGTLAAPQLTATSQFIGSFIINGEVFWIDGKQCRVYNPKDDTVLEWKSRTSGSIPTDCKLGCTWRSRAVLARGASDPQAWHMSAFSDPYDWDRFPPIVTPTQAISGTNAQAGQPPDIINALVPASDDLLVFLCDHSIWRLTGDPMAGGQLDCVSQNIGGAFGPSWCKGPEGEVYFFGSRGGVYLLNFAGPPIPLTEGRIEREMSEFDFGAYYPLLQWNDRDNGLHVFQVPYGAGGVIVRHWFWSKKTNGWFPDELGLVLSTGVQPTTAWTIDGDEADDRSLLIGCEDGYVRRWDQNARSDDSLVIEGRAMLGPFCGFPGKRTRVTCLNVELADDQDGCRYEVYASETADTPGLPVCQGGLSPGRNRVGIRACGNFIWVQFRNAQNGTRFSIERASLEGFPAGRATERLRG